MTPDFTNISYLKEGNQRQQEAYKALTELLIFDELDVYSPVLTGTIPIGIDIPESDLDIVCQCSDHGEFTNKLTLLYADKDQFDVRVNTWNGLKSTIVSFWFGGFEIEVFGQDCPSQKQNAYKHMLIED